MTRPGCWTCHALVAHPADLVDHHVEYRRSGVTWRAVFLGRLCRVCVESTVAAHRPVTDSGSCGYCGGPATFERHSAIADITGLVDLADGWRCTPCADREIRSMVPDPAPEPARQADLFSP